MLVSGSVLILLGRRHDRTKLGPEERRAWSSFRETTNQCLRWPSAPARDAETQDPTSRRPPSVDGLPGAEPGAIAMPNCRCDASGATATIRLLPTMTVRLVVCRPLCFLGWAVYIIHIYTWVWAFSCHGPWAGAHAALPQGRPCPGRPATSY